MPSKHFLKTKEALPRTEREIAFFRFQFACFEAARLLATNRRSNAARAALEFRDFTWKKLVQTLSPTPPDKSVL